MHIFKREIFRQNTVITLEIQSLDASNAELVTRSLKAALRDERQVILDLGALRHFDVNGFAAILKWAADAEGSEVRLCSQSGTIQALFELLGANSLIPLYESREVAVASFRNPGLRQNAGYTDLMSPRGPQAVPGQRTLREP
jgi:anti-anti-sigma factor